jgi:hypothetical protein
VAMHARDVLDNTAGGAPDGPDHRPEGTGPSCT